MLKPVANLFKALCSNAHPGGIAHAVSVGLLLGLMPKNNLLWYLVFVFCLFVRFNRAMYLLMILFSSAIAVAFDPLFDRLGYAFLTIPSLANFFGWLLDIPFVAFTKFNNTVVCGSLLAGLLLYVPVNVLARVLLKVWRRYAVPVLRRTPIVKALGKLPFFAAIADSVQG
ncbi:MAG: TIGR03546 family protein [Treponema sp.]|nr:TIGR03546 family protein [Treponema sp.]